MIELKNVSKYYNSGDITNLGLRNINLKLNKNEIVAIVGESGSGKSTLLNVLTKIDTFDEGEIYYKGNETSYFSISDMDDFRKNKVGFIFQNYNIIDSYTVLENVMVPLLLKGIDKNNAKIKALEIIKKVGLLGRETHRGTKLSGGEKQRCVIARALASDCEILACDEPTGNLDSKTGKEIIALIKEVSKDKLVLIVTHNYKEVEDIVTRKLRVNDGELVEDTYVNENNIEEDIKEDLNLDYVPLKKKTKIEIAKNNIVYTPRKTILLSLVFFVIGFIFLFLIQLTTTVYVSLSGENTYINTQKNRVVVYDKDYNKLDSNKVNEISDNIILNSMYEDSYYTIDYIDVNSSYVEYFYNSIYSPYYDVRKVDYGRLPENDNEIFLIIPNVMNNNNMKDNLDQTLHIINNEYQINTNIALKLVGYSTQSENNNTYFFGTNKLSKYLFNAFICNNITASIENETRIVTSDVRLLDTIDDITVYLPKSYENNSEVKLYLNNLYQIKNFTFQYAEISSPNISIPRNIEMIDEVFQISIYENNVSSIKRKVEDLGYQADIPYKLDSNSNAISFILKVISYCLIFFLLLGMVGVFYITYIILARIYSSKKNDYQILRTLGVTKKDMKSIVNIEVFIIGFTTSIISYIILTILVYIIPALYDYKPISFVNSIIYFITMAIFSYAIGMRFNTKLFKFSVSKSLRGEE